MKDLKHLNEKKCMNKDVNFEMEKEYRLKRCWRMERTRDLSS